MPDVEVIEHLSRIVTASTESAALDQLVEALLTTTDSSQVAALLLGADGLPAHVSAEGLLPEQVDSVLAIGSPDEVSQRLQSGEVDRSASRLLAPLRLEDEMLGTVFVARAPGDTDFDDADERAVVALTRTATAVIRRLRGNGLPDPRPDVVLGDGQIRRLLRTAREVLGSDLALISEIAGATQTLRYVDGSDGSSLEGRSFPLADSPCGLMLTSRIPASVPDLGANRLTAELPVHRSMGYDAYCGVPIRTAGDYLFGSLCALDHTTRHDPPTEDQLERLRLIADLIGSEIAVHREAAEIGVREREMFLHRIEEDRRLVHLQPIVELASGRTVGFEALARFKDPVRGFRRPDLVFAEAAEFGLHVRLEEDMLRRAVACLAALPPNAFLSVNLSPEALVAHDVGFALGEVGDLDRLVIELTEHEGVEDYPPLVRTLDRLRGNGARLAVDDVGAGYASLRHATRLRPDILKLDSTLVRDLDTDGPRRAVARAIAGLCADIGAVMVAEGIETEAELQQVVELGGTLGQGYFLGRPAPLDEIV